MGQRCEIDERDIDRLLSALTDRQIAQLFGMSELEVWEIRQSRTSKKPRFEAGDGINGEEEP